MAQAREEAPPRWPAGGLDKGIRWKHLLRKVLGAQPLPSRANSCPCSLRDRANKPPPVSGPCFAHAKSCDKASTILQTSRASRVQPPTSMQPVIPRLSQRTHNQTVAAGSAELNPILRVAPEPEIIRPTLAGFPLLRAVPQPDQSGLNFACFNSMGLPNLPGVSAIGSRLRAVSL